MAGGTFDKLVGKTRPGTYINFESNRTDVVGGGERGITVIPLPSPAYVSEGEFIMLTSAAPDAAMSKLGYSIYDEDKGRQMLLIREAFKNASTVYVYPVATGGTKATYTSGELTATAACAGSRGNSLSFAIEKNTISGYDVEVYLDGTLVAAYEQLETIEELIAQGCEYITFSGSGDLEAVAGVTLTGGEDGTVANEAVTAFLDGLEKIKFNTVAFPFTNTSLISAAKTKIKYLRESVGKGVQVVVADNACDYEGVINVTNSVALDDVELTHAEATAWVAGATAAAKNTESLTYVTYEGATDIIDVKTHEEAVAAIKAGEFFFSLSEAGNIVVEYDINSLVTYGDTKDKTYSKNRVIRVFDTFSESVQLNFPPNKFNNNAEGWEIMEGIGRTILKQYEDAGAITEVDYDNDFTVDTELSTGDETYFNVGLQPVDSAEKLYFTVATR